MLGWAWVSASNQVFWKVICNTVKNYFSINIWILCLYFWVFFSSHLCSAAYQQRSKVRKLRWGSHLMNDVVWLHREQLREECMQQQKKKRSMQKHSISISNRPCLIHWPTKLLEGCQFVKAVSAQQHLLMMQHPSVSQPPFTGCEVVDACYMIWSMLREGSRVSVWDTEHSRSETVKTKKSAGIRCHIPATVEAVNTWPGSHSLCASQDPPWITFLFEDRGGQRVLCRCVYAAAGCRCACAEEVWT